MAIINHAPEWIQVTDPLGRIVYSNQYGEEIGEASNWVGKSIFDIVLPEYADIVQKIFRTVLSTGCQGSFEAAFVHNHERKWFHTLVVPLNDGLLSSGEEPGPELVLFHREASPYWTAYEAIQQRADDLEKRLAERNLALQEYTRLVEAGEKLNIQLTQLNQVPVVLQTLAEQVMRAMNTGFAAVYRIEKDWIEYSAGVKAPVMLHRAQCLEDDGVLGQLLLGNTIKFLEQLDNETASLLWREMPRDFPINSLVIAPISCENAFQGILYVGYDRVIRFSQNEEVVLRAFIETTIDTLHRIHVMQQLERNIQAREQEISLLYDLSTYSSEPIEFDILIEKSLRRIMRAARCDTGLILWNVENSAQEEMVSCWPQTGIPEPVRSFLRESSLSNKFENGETHRIVTIPPEQLCACINVPVRSKRKPNSCMRLFGDPRTLHQPEITHLIVSAARQLGLSIDSALDRKLAEEAVVLEERQRMARNLHDSITQSLYALSLSSDVALKAFDRQEGDRLRAALEDVTSSSLQTLKEMRLMLFELRPSALENAGLLEALELRLNTVERRSGMEAHLECARKVKIPDTLEVELYSIISEALNNSLRHSGAREVWVRVRAAAHMISVEVEDNGKGFEIQTLSQGGMGLTIMHERARKLGGNLAVSSSAGKGTRINFKVRIQGEV